MAMRTLPFHRALHRPRMFLGGEREPAMMIALIAGTVAVTGMNMICFVVGIVLWCGSIPLLRMMGKSDPRMMRVWMRHRKYRGYYDARSRPAAGDTMSGATMNTILAVVVGSFGLFVMFRYGVF